MKITFLEHSGFVVETAAAVLVFDYFKDPQGIVAGLLSGSKPVTFFVSHGHPDHYNSSILQAAKRAGVRYVMDRDTAVAHPSVRQLGDDRLTTVSEGDRLDGPACGCPGIDRLAVFGSNDEGVSFILRLADTGELIYFAGDLNDWDWQDDPAPVPQMQKDYRIQLERMQRDLLALEGVERFGRGGVARGGAVHPPRQEVPVVDVAFIPVDLRLQEKAFNGAEIWLEYMYPKWLIPMHLNGGTELPKELAARLAERPAAAGVQVGSLTRPGESVRISSVR
jgi:L-ascorbate metabolism protein UlaG (beta-lactamase superfamily)